MAGFKLLIDTNVVIGLEDAQPVQASLAELVRLVEHVVNVTSADELITQTAKRSVFSAEDLTRMAPSPHSPVKMIDFLLAGHSEPSVPLTKLVSTGIFNSRPPQSIAELTERRYAALKDLLQLGFDI